ncbi:MAG: alanine racemase [Bacteroidota bacterium]|nr:alanine racemase [Bacteroidota bacterium]
MIIKPTLLIDKSKCKKNIATMFLKAQKNQLSFRPHFKTHQSLEIGQWFKSVGVSKITVSSFEMAEYFSAQWDDITVAFPVNILEIETINKLADKISLNVLVESVEAALFLKQQLKNRLGVFIKIDVGYHRTGISPSDKPKIDNIIEVIRTAKNMNFKGFLTHAGHIYGCRNKTEILNVHNKTVAILREIKKQYIKEFPDCLVSLGDTPSCSVADDFAGIDEIRPGNFVFYDLMQYQIGSCKIDQIAVAMACPIVAVYADRNEIVVYGGGVHFSKDRLEDKTYATIFGKVVEKCEDGWGDLIPNMYVKSLSQDHGIISVPKSEIVNYKIGDYLLILPVHSCMTANAMKSYKNNSETIDRL